VPSPGTTGTRPNLLHRSKNLEATQDTESILSARTKHQASSIKHQARNRGAEHKLKVNYLLPTYLTYLTTRTTTCDIDTKPELLTPVPHQQFQLSRPLLFPLRCHPLSSYLRHLNLQGSFSSCPHNSDTRIQLLQTCSSSDCSLSDIIAQLFTSIFAQRPPRPSVTIAPKHRRLLSNRHFRLSLRVPDHNSAPRPLFCDCDRDRAFHRDN
jgi:hypothetical protein